MGTIVAEAILNTSIMGKLQSITLATAISILGLGSIQISHADPSSNLSLKDATKLAQKSETSTDNSSEDEMIDALQERQEKLENLEVLKNLTKNNNILDALEKQEFNIQSVEDLESVKEIVNDESLDSNEILNLLQGRQIDVQDVEDIED